MAMYGLTYSFYHSRGGGLEGEMVELDTLRRLYNEIRKMFERKVL